MRHNMSCSSSIFISFISGCCTWPWNPGERTNDFYTQKAKERLNASLSSGSMCQVWLFSLLLRVHVSKNALMNTALINVSEIRLFVAQKKCLQRPVLMGMWTGLEHMKQTEGGCYPTDLSVLPPLSSIWWRQLACCRWLCRWAPSHSPRWPHPRGSQWLD